MTADAGTLEAHGIVVDRGRNRALADVTLSVGAGELIGVLGANGAGKSSLLKALAGLIAPAAGHITLGGVAMSSWDRRARARAIAYLPQERVIHWPLSARSAVALGRFPYAGGESLYPADAVVVEAALAAMDALHLAERPVSELSGGELARVLLARALAQDTHYLLADEPTAGLDPAHQIALFERLVSLAQRGRTVLVAIHDLSFAARYCHRIVLLKEGRCLADGPPGEVLTDPLLAEAFGIRARLVTVDGARVVVPLSTLAL